MALGSAMFTSVANLAGMGANGYALIDIANHFDTRFNEPVSRKTKKRVAELILAQSPSSQHSVADLLESIALKNLPFSAAVASVVVKRSQQRRQPDQAANTMSRKIHSDLQVDTGKFFQKAFLQQAQPLEDERFVEPRSTFGRLRFRQVDDNSSSSALLPATSSLIFSSPTVALSLPVCAFAHVQPSARVRLVHVQLIYC
jgi:hypothetical protein